MNTRMKGGYVGLIVLLLSVLILGILFARWMSIPSQKSQADVSVQSLTASGTVPTSRTEEYRADIDVAKSIQNTVDVRSVKIEREL